MLFRSQGDTHDHISEWTDANTMIAHYEWEQNGKQMRENVIFRFAREKDMDFRSVVTENGQEVGAFFGKLSR